MKTFKEFTSKCGNLDEGVMRKGAVSAYALHGKRHGDRAASNYRDAKNAVTTTSLNDFESKIDALMKASAALADGLSSTRDQLGSVSAQITALATLK